MHWRRWPGKMRSSYLDALIELTLQWRPHDITCHIKGLCNGLTSVALSPTCSSQQINNKSGWNRNKPQCCCDINVYVVLTWYPAIGWATKSSKPLFFLFGMWLQIPPTQPLQFEISPSSTWAPTVQSEHADAAFSNGGYFSQNNSQPLPPTSVHNRLGT